MVKTAKIKLSATLIDILEEAIRYEGKAQN